MAKSLRSKIMRRMRKLKRGQIDKVVMKPKADKITHNLQASLVGMEYREQEKKNAYLYPNEKDSVFPQVVPAPILDLRSAFIPGSGRQWSGAKIKNRTITQQFNYDGSQEQQQMQQKKNDKNESQMKQEIPKNPPGYKIKKSKRNSKIRKTIVF